MAKDKGLDVVGFKPDFEGQYKKIRGSWEAHIDAPDQYRFTSRGDLMRSWMINENGGQGDNLRTVSFDPNYYRLSLSFDEMKVTFQAVDMHEYRSMEFLIDRL